MATVTKIEAKFEPTIAKKRVAAYARVSSDKDAMLMSLSAQISYYNSYISTHHDWELVEIYSDEGISGTKEDRPGFQRMLADCRSGKIDTIIAKSITRFARNTVVLLETIRELKNLGIDVFFEKENIHTLSSEGEFMLTLLASYAQEEARSASENQLWRIKKNFEQGIPNGCLYYGYRFSNGKLIIKEDEAKIVREVYDLYLSGYGIFKIARLLNDRKVPTRLGGLWRGGRIYSMLKDEVYIGNLLLQKTYSKDFLTKQRMVNHGEKPMYEVLESHDAIISESIFHKVREEMARRKAINDSRHCQTSIEAKPAFLSLLKCKNCGKNYKRRKNCGHYIWMCSTYHDYGKKYCNSQRIREDILVESILQALGINSLDEVNLGDIFEKIVLCNHQIIELHYKDGNIEELEWRQKSRSESWTPDMREKARKITTERNRRKKDGDN